MNKKKNSDSFALYNFPYYRGSLDRPLAYPVKAMLSCLSAAFGAAYLAQLLGFHEGIFLFSAAAFCACGVYFVLLGFFKALPVTLFTLCGLSAVGLFAVEKLDLIVSANDFWLYYSMVARGEILDGKSYFRHTSHIDPVPFMVILCILFGIVFAYCTAKRFHPDAVVVFSAALAIPSFLSSTACFYPSLTIFIGGLLGIWAANQSMTSNIVLTFGGALSTREAEKRYRKEVRAYTPVKRFISDGNRYSKFLSDGIIVFVIVSLIMSIAASSFPVDGSIKFDRLIQKVIAWGEDVGDYFSETFSELDFNLGGKNYLKGFFSADGNSINISNSINPDSADRDGRPVLKVTAENRDKLYLRGDIGYRFDGNNWESISTLDCSAIRYSPSNNLWGEIATSGEEISLEEVLNSYAPEMQTYIAKNFLSANSDNTIGMETVKIDYLKHMNTVLFPGTPFVLNFRENENFRLYGDFVAVGNNSINSMETGVLYFNQPPQLENYSIGSKLFDRLEMPISYSQYQDYINVYENFVSDYYGSQLDLKYYEIIEKFAQSCYDTITADELYGSGNHIEAYCNAVMNYLNSGEYKYSLDEDNFSSGKDPLETFLYSTKKGHCAMYATAMCLALRYRGIPARYVTGFTVGGNKCEQTEEGYVYTLTDKDLHAWVEVYFEDAGWVPYDPTPGTYRNPSPSAPVTEVTSDTTVTTEETTAASSENTTTTSSTPETDEGETSAVTGSVTDENPGGSALDPNTVRIILIILGSVLILFVLFMSVAGFIKKLNRKQREKLKFFEQGDPTKAVKAMLGFMLKLLALRGIVRIKGETPKEFGKRTDDTLKMENAAESAIPIFEKSEFDREPTFDEGERSAVFECVKKLLNDTLDGMKRTKRLITRIKLFGGKNEL